MKIIAIINLKCWKKRIRSLLNYDGYTIHSVKGYKLDPLS